MGCNIVKRIPPQGLVGIAIRKTKIKLITAAVWKERYRCLGEKIQSSKDLFFLQPLLPFLTFLSVL